MDLRRGLIFAPRIAYLTVEVADRGYMDEYYFMLLLGWKAGQRNSKADA